MSESGATRAGTSAASTRRRRANSVVRMRGGPVRQIDDKSETGKLARARLKMQAEQIESLNAKTEEELQFLHSVRDFVRKRAELESDFSKKMRALVGTFVEQRSTPQTSGLSRLKRTRKTVRTSIDASTEAQEARMSEVWIRVLNQTDKFSSHRGALADKLLQAVAEHIENLDSKKTFVARKVVDLGKMLQDDLSSSYADVEDARREYATLEKITQACKGKYERKNLKRNQPKGFLSRKDPHAACMQALERYNSAAADSESARHRYLLRLAEANAHQKHYYEIQMSQLLNELDFDFFEAVRDAFLSYCNVEDDYITSTKLCLGEIRRSAGEIDRRREREAFLKENDSLFQTPEGVPFEPVHGGDDEPGEIVSSETSRRELQSIMRDLEIESYDVSKLVRKLQGAVKELKEATKRRRESMPDANDPAKDAVEDIELEHTRRQLDGAILRLAEIKAQIEKLVKAGVSKSNGSAPEEDIAADVHPDSPDLPRGVPSAIIMGSSTPTGGSISGAASHGKRRSFLGLMLPGTRVKSTGSMEIPREVLDRASALEDDGDSDGADDDDDWAADGARPRGGAATPTNLSRRTSNGSAASVPLHVGAAHLEVSGGNRTRAITTGAASQRPDGLGVPVSRARAATGGSYQQAPPSLWRRPSTESASHVSEAGDTLSEGAELSFAFAEPPSMLATQAAVGELGSSTESLAQYGAFDVVAPPRKSVVQYKYDGQLKHELALNAGDIVYVTGENTDGWCQGRTEEGGRTGVFPSSYVHAITFEEEQAILRRRAVAIPPGNSAVASVSAATARTGTPSAAIVADDSAAKALAAAVAAGEAERAQRARVEAAEKERKERERRESELKERQEREERERVEAEQKAAAERAAKEIELAAKAKAATAATTTASPSPGTDKARALYKYSARDAKELSLVAGAIVTITSRALEQYGWLEGTLDGKTGRFPLTYVKLFSADETPSPSAPAQQQQQQQTPTTARTPAKASGGDESGSSFGPPPPAEFSGAMELPPPPVDFVPQTSAGQAAGGRGRGASVGESVSSTSGRRLSGAGDASSGVEHPPVVKARRGSQVDPNELPPPGIVALNPFKRMDSNEALMQNQSVVLQAAYVMSPDAPSSVSYVRQSGAPTPGHTPGQPSGRHRTLSTDSNSTPVRAPPLSHSASTPIGRLAAAEDFRAGGEFPLPPPQFDMPSPATTPSKITLSSSGSYAKPGQGYTKVRALHDYIARTPNELTFRAGDVIDIVGDASIAGEGHIVGRLGNSDGLVSLSRVEAVMARGTTQQGVTPDDVHWSELVDLADREIFDTTTRVRALFEWDAYRPTELSFKAGDVLEIVSRKTGEVGWWEGRLHGRVGLFPITFVEGVANDLHIMSSVRLLRVKGDKQASLELLPVSRASLLSTDVYLLDVGRKVFIWIGSRANPLEKRNSHFALQHIRAERPQSYIGSTVVDEGREDDEFLAYIDHAR